MYSITEHRHRFSIWAAGRAATVKGCRFSVEQAKIILESTDLYRVAQGIDHLPCSDEFDGVHRGWRIAIIEAAKANDLDFTHRIAAKLINIYLKSLFLCDVYLQDNRVKAIHPPIDRVLLNALYEQNIGDRKSGWQEARKRRWSKFSSYEYETVIRAIRSVIPANGGLWEIEAYWQGFQ